MKFIAAAALSLAAVAALPAHAAGTTTAAREGTRMTVEFTMTYKASPKTSFSTATVERVVRASCKVEALPLKDYGVMGPTPEQEKAMQGGQYTSDMQNLEREVGKCKGDQACIMRVMERVAAQGGIEPPAAGGSIQQWHPRGCGATFKVDERHNVNDRGGEGGGGAYQETKTITGTNTIQAKEEDGWEGVYIDHDLAKGSSQYFFTTPQAMSFDMTAVRTGHGAGTKNGKVDIAFVDGEVPRPWAALKGPPSNGKATKQVGGGTMTVEWVIKR